MPKSDKKPHRSGPVHSSPRQAAPACPPAKKVVPSREVEDLDEVTCTADQLPVMLVSSSSIDTLCKEDKVKGTTLIEEDFFEESGEPAYEKSDFNEDVPMLGVGCEVEVMTSPVQQTCQMMSKLDPFLSYGVDDHGGLPPPWDFGCQPLPSTDGEYYTQYNNLKDPPLGQQQVCQEDAFELNNGSIYIGDLVQTLEKICPSMLNEVMEMNPTLYEGVEDLGETLEHCDEGFDDKMSDPKASVASTPQVSGIKRPHEDEAECHIPLVVGDFDPLVEDTEAMEESVAALTEESPYNKNVTFRCKGRAAAISCSPETTGQDLKQIAKLHGVLDELGVVNDIMLMTPTGRYVGDTDLVSANMEVNVIELPSMQKKRKFDTRIKQR